MRILKIVLFVAAIGFVLVMAIGAGGIYWTTNGYLKTTYSVSVRPVTIPNTPAAIARGKHLALTRGCFECHGDNLGGKLVMDSGAMGQVEGPNLTRGQGGMPASTTDEDYVRAIRHGVARDGRGLFIMPSEDYATLSDEDMGALVAYLKSVPPVNRERMPIKVGPIARMLIAMQVIKVAAEKIDHAAVIPSTVSPGLTAEYGAYIANACIGCHGPNLSGGKIASGPPDWPPAANLTPHADGRLATWSESDFLQTLRTGKRPDGSAVNPVMPLALGQMNDTELKALWIYLRTLPPAATGAR